MFLRGFEKSKLLKRGVDIVVCCQEGKIVLRFAFRGEWRMDSGNVFKYRSDLNVDENP